MMSVLAKINVSTIRSQSASLEDMRNFLIELEQEFDFTENSDGELETITFYPNSKYDFDTGGCANSLTFDKRVNFVRAGTGRSR